MGHALPFETNGLPPLLKPEFDEIPDELKERRQWINWEAVWLPQKSKYSKIPYNSRTNTRASTTDPATWSTFAEARRAYERNPLTDDARTEGEDSPLRFAGVGYVLWKKPPCPEPASGESEAVYRSHLARWESYPESDFFIGVDLDKGIDPEQASAWIESFESYAERSPSGEGYRIFGIAKLPKEGRKRGDIEVYEAGRFLTVTGHRIKNAPVFIAECQEALTRFHREVWPPKDKNQRGSATGKGFDGSELDILAAALSNPSNGTRIAAVYSGDISAYKGLSEAEFAFCNFFAYYVGPSGHATLDNLYRASGLYQVRLASDKPGKWDEKRYASGELYGEHTIAKAISGCGRFYVPYQPPAREEAPPYSQMETGFHRDDDLPPGAEEEAFDESPTLAKGKKTKAAKSTKAKAASGEGDDDGGRGPSIATQLVKIARQRFRLWHTPKYVAYVDFDVDGHKETWEVESKGFRDMLSVIWFSETGAAVPPSAMQSAIATISAFACRKGPQRPVYTRKADRLSEDGAIWIDLCNDKWQAVKVTAEGWSIVDDHPVAFRRTRGMLPLPAPIPGGCVTELQAFVNTPTEGEGSDLFVLMIAWLLGVLGPHVPYPILNLTGEQGCGKTGFARICRALVDPAQPDLRKEPKEDRDLAIAASNAFVVAYDNLSGLPSWLSDTLCCLSTGGGFGTRKLHSDDDEMLFSFQSPVLLTGIGEASTRGDFLERTLLLNLPTITEERRKEERDVREGFEEARPRLLGALLTIVSEGLRNRGKTRLTELPRMADFANWVAACEPACPWESGSFIEAFRDNQAAGGRASLEADKVAPLLIRLIDSQQDTPGSWQGTATELLEALKTLAAGSDDTKRRRFDNLPSNARALSVSLKRIAPSLRKEEGIEIINLPKDSKGTRNTKITRSERTTAQNHGAKPDDGLFAPSPLTVNAPVYGAKAQTAQNPPHSSSIISQPKKKEKEGERAENGGETDRRENTGNFAPFVPSAVEDEPEPPQEAYSAAVKAAREGMMPEQCEPVRLYKGRQTNAPRSHLLSILNTARALREEHGANWKDQGDGPYIFGDWRAIAHWWHVRPKSTGLCRWSMTDISGESYHQVEIKVGTIVAHGFGRTPEEAIADIRATIRGGPYDTNERDQLAAVAQQLDYSVPNNPGGEAQQ